MDFDENKKLLEAIQNIENRRNKLEEDYNSLKYKQKARIEEAKRRKEEYGELKKQLEVEKRSIVALNEISKIYEKFSIRSSIEDILQNIISILFGSDKYQFRFIKKNMRNQQELYIYMIHKIDETECMIPIENSSGGARDIIDIIVRILIMKNLPVEQRTLLLDEPMKNLSRDLRQDFFKFIKELCQEFKIQIIMVSHEIEYIEEIDKIYEFSHDGSKTVIKEIK